MHGPGCSNAGLSIHCCCCPVVQECREAGKQGDSPDLAAALPGMSAAKLFVGGWVVREGLTVQEMVDLAAAAGMTVVLPTGWAIFGPDSLPMPP